MKKFLFVAVLALASCVVHAQAPSSYNGKLTGAAQDTLTNSAADTLTLSVKGEKNAVTFQYNITKISGTVAGTIKVYGSIDETKYALLNTYTLTDASAIASYSMSYNGYSKYRLIIATTGSQASAYEIWALYR